MFTVFNLRSGNLTLQGLALRGRLDVRAGMRVTAVLSVPDQWATLMAWRFEDSGKEIWMRNISPTIAVTWLITAMLISVLTGIAIVLAALDSMQPAFGIGLGSLCLALFIGKAFSDWRSARTIAVLLRAVPDASPSLS
ncbi:hypothetical protein [Ralstonia sp. A12]|uniref:hypothetical protein n=1 Tax=Ralstonia sp. A12 TaxID=1217052 RepID=UPI0012EE2C34|nr:hypothetical protein [Ralstonia sp. A12]